MKATRQQQMRTRATACPFASLPDMLDGLTGTFLSDDEEEVEHTEDDSEDLPRQQEARPPAPAEVEIKKAA